MGLEDVLGEKPGPPALGKGGQPKFLSPSAEFLPIDKKVDSPPIDIELNQVSISDEGERAADSCLGRDV